MKSVSQSLSEYPHFFEPNQNGHNSVNFEATASRFCMEEDLEEEDEVEEVNDDDNDDNNNNTSKNGFFCIFCIFWIFAFFAFFFAFFISSAFLMFFPKVGFFPTLALDP